MNKLAACIALIVMQIFLVSCSKSNPKVSQAHASSVRKIDSYIVAGSGADEKSVSVALKGIGFNEVDKFQRPDFENFVNYGESYAKLSRVIKEGDGSTINTDCLVYVKDHTCYLLLDLNESRVDGDFQWREVASLVKKTLSKNFVVKPNLWK